MTLGDHNTIADPAVWWSLTHHSRTF